jgi:hypothetical protein
MLTGNQQNQTKESLKRKAPCHMIGNIEDMKTIVERPSDDDDDDDDEDDKGKGKVHPRTDHEGPEGE